MCVILFHSFHRERISAPERVVQQLQAQIHKLEGKAGQDPGETPGSPPQGASPDEGKKIAPFSDWDWTRLNGNPRTKDIYWDSNFFTPEIRADINCTYDLNHPADHSMGGPSELFRSNEIQVEQLGGDFHYNNVRGRLMTQFGMYSVTTPRNDASPANGQWDLSDAYRCNQGQNNCPHPEFLQSSHFDPP